MPLGGAANRHPARQGRLLVKREAGGVVEDVACGEERRVDVDCRSGDPQIVGVVSIMERMTGTSAGKSQLSSNCEQLVAEGDDRRGLNRFLEPLAPGVAPPSDECPVSEFAYGDGRQKDLITRHVGDLRLEPLAATAAE